MTLPVLVQQRALTQPDLDVLTFEHEGHTETRTFQQLWHNAQRIANGLADRGVGQGDRFALLMLNRPEFVECMIAAGILGAVFVPVDPRTRGDKLAFMLRDAGCVGVVCEPTAQETVHECLVSVPSLAWVYVQGAAARPGPGGFTAALDSLLSAPLPPLREVRAAQLSDTMQIMYTSGTTGDPKGVVVRHARFAFVAKQGELVFGYRPSDRPYTGLSLTHGNAQFLTLAPSLKMGLRAVISRKFTKSRLWEVVRRHGCTTFSLLGGMVTAIYSEPPRADDADNPVRFVISAGMPAALWEAFAQRFGVQIFEFYGAMEGGMTINPIGEGPVGSCGRVAPGLQARVVDECGQDVPPGTPGELWFRPSDGSAPVVEYFRNPQASAAKTAGGWLRSGDIVTMDADGWVFFCHRQGGGIRHNGDFISPAHLEKVIAEHPGVSDVAVYGVPAASGAAGEMDVVAAIVPTAGLPFDAASVFAWCRERVEPNAVPAWLQEVAELPKTASEKVQPRFLLQMFNEKSAPLHVEAARC